MKDADRKSKEYRRKQLKAIRSICSQAVNRTIYHKNKCRLNVVKK